MARKAKSSKLSNKPLKGRKLGRVLAELQAKYEPTDQNKKEKGDDYSKILKLIDDSR